MINIPVTIQQPRLLNVLTPDNLSINILPAAVIQFEKLYAERRAQDDFSIIRVVIKGGGCAGYRYTFEFEPFIADINNDIDYLIKEDTFMIIIDAPSATLINGSTIDYVSELMSSQFVINVPNAKSCGCGESFII